MLPGDELLVHRRCANALGACSALDLKVRRATLNNTPEKPLSMQHSVHESKSSTMALMSSANT
jgi:hypothetical protein